FRLVQRLWPPDGLSACPTRVPCCCAAFAAKFEFEFSKTCEYASDHPSCRVGRVDPFAQRPQNDVPIPQLPDRDHNLGGVETQSVNTDDNDGVTGTGVVQ